MCTHKCNNLSRTDIWLARANTVVAGDYIDVDVFSSFSCTCMLSNQAIRIVRIVCRMCAPEIVLVCIYAFIQTGLGSRHACMSTFRKEKKRWYVL